MVNVTAILTWVRPFLRHLSTFTTTYVLKLSSKFEKLMQFSRLLKIFENS